jgi:hypothetical protein
MSKLTVTVTAFKSYRRGTLVGFASAFIPQMHLAIHGIAVHRHVSGAHWVQLPAKPVLDADGNPKRTPEGRVTYATVLNFDSREVGTAFSEAVIRALLKFDPNAFEEESAA